MIKESQRKLASYGNNFVEKIIKTPRDNGVKERELLRKLGPNIDVTNK